MQPWEQGVGTYVGHQQHEERKEEVEVKRAGVAGGQKNFAVGGQGVDKERDALRVGIETPQQEARPWVRTMRFIDRTCRSAASPSMVSSAR